MVFTLLEGYFKKHKTTKNKQTKMSLDIVKFFLGGKAEPPLIENH